MEREGRRENSLVGHSGHTQRTHTADIPGTDNTQLVERASLTPQHVEMLERLNTFSDVQRSDLCCDNIAPFLY